MNALIQHRGPDGEGYFYVDDKFTASLFSGNDTQGEDSNALVGFGHRRLSILDLSSLGHQPMRYKEDRYWITYNGEIFNYIELRNELIALGHDFASQSDTEVILAAYDQWGVDCLSRFNGMWAFAIYDAEKKTVFLARDRFGIKPLYYWVSPDKKFFFGSEIKQFTALPGWRAVLNSQRAYDFLNWGITDHTDETLFNGVYHIRPGHYALIAVDDISADAGGRVSLHQWYTLNPSPFMGSYDEACKKLNALLSDSVRLRLRSDVPVGSCLSGGVDSSSIVCLMHNQLTQDGAQDTQKTFSACSDIKKIDERKWMEQVVEQTGVQAHYTYPDMKNLLSESETITWHQDEPFGSTSIYAQWNVFKLSAENDVRVILDGQGADEQLAGYHSFFGVRLYGLLMTGRWVQMVREIYKIGNLHGYSLFWIIGYMATPVLPELLRQFILRMVGRSVSRPGWIDLDRLKAKATESYHLSKKTVSALCYSQMMSTNLQMLLHWEDRNSMAHSIESRVPFLDYRLVEFSMSLPDDYKIKDGITKRVLRDGMNGILPDSIKNRIDKISFATPEELWLREKSPDVFRQKLLESIDLSKGIINKEAIGLLEDIISGKRPFSFAVWRMINFGQWMKRFSVQLADDQCETK